MEGSILANRGRPAPSSITPTSITITAQQLIDDYPSASQHTFTFGPFPAGTRALGGDVQFAVQFTGAGLDELTLKAGPPDAPDALCLCAPSAYDDTRAWLGSTVGGGTDPFVDLSDVSVSVTVSVSADPGPVTFGDLDPGGSVTLTFLSAIATP